jgi:hypothetical protein
MTKSILNDEKIILQLALVPFSELQTNQFSPIYYKKNEVKVSINLNDIQEDKVVTV